MTLLDGKVVVDETLWSYRPQRVTVDELHESSSDEEIIENQSQLSD